MIYMNIHDGVKLIELIRNIEPDATAYLLLKPQLPVVWMQMVFATASSLVVLFDCSTVVRCRLTASDNSLGIISFVTLFSAIDESQLKASFVLTSQAYFLTD